MGEEVSGTRFSRLHRRRYREKVHLCLDVFTDLLATTVFETERTSIGLEIEFNLVDGAQRPFLDNRTVLRTIHDPVFQPELGAFNIELNLPPQPLSGDGLFELELALQRSLCLAEKSAVRHGAHVVMVGILPTLLPEHLRGEAWMTPSNRYAALNDSILAARGEDLHLDITGQERLTAHWPCLAPEAACTSVQLHLQVPPHGFADAWNASQVLAGPQLALGANSPFLFGRHLWPETRIELFLQAVDTRSPELRNQGVRPRAWFGERWITSIFDLFEENVRYFPALLPEVSDEDPRAVLDAGGTPLLPELRLHNGTVYRWNRPVYDVVDGRPHLRVENRVLPAGPSAVDVVANAAFYYGALRALIDDDRPAWSMIPFDVARWNLYSCARHGLGARIRWPGLGETGVGELVLRELLPQAHEGLRRWGVPSALRERYLGVIEGRVGSGVNGAVWQAETVRALQDAGVCRSEALTGMLGAYHEYMRSNLPVHTWPSDRETG
jgi:hypothetical protein